MHSRDLALTSQTQCSRVQNLLANRDSSPVGVDGTRSSAGSEPRGSWSLVGTYSYSAWNSACAFALRLALACASFFLSLGTHSLSFAASQPSALCLGFLLSSSVAPGHAACQRA